jgi:hypothetical protein
MTATEHVPYDPDPHSMDLTDYAAALRIMRDPNMPLMQRFHAARAASAYDDQIQLAAVDNPKVRYLRPHQEEERIRYYEQLAKKAQAWLDQNGGPISGANTIAIRGPGMMQQAPYPRSVAQHEIS